MKHRITGTRRGWTLHVDGVEIVADMECPFLLISLVITGEPESAWLN